MRPLTSEELTQVELATKGESRARRQYPPEVVAVWIAAEIVRRPGRTPTAETVGAQVSAAPRYCLAAVLHDLHSANSLPQR